MKNLFRNLFFVCFFLLHVFYFLPEEAIEFPTTDKPVLLYSQSLKSLVLDTIAGAKKNLHIATFTLSDPSVIKAIKAASDRGVEVFVAVDKKGFQGKKSTLGEATHLSQRKITGLMHQKWIIADEKLSLIGSANLTYDSLHNQHNLLIAIDSPLFAKQLLVEAKKKKPSYTLPIGMSWKTILPPYTLTSWTAPRNPEIKDALGTAIDTAQKTLQIALFTFTEKELLEKVVDAKKRGVEVTVLLDRAQTMGPSSKVFSRLLQENIPVGLSIGKPLLHHKFVWIDKEKLFTGSFNWTKAALTQNEELLTLFEGGNLEDPFWQSLEATWKGLQEKVEWQKGEDWKDENWSYWLWQDGQSPCLSSSIKGSHPFSDSFPLAA